MKISSSTATHNVPTPLRSDRILEQNQNAAQVSNLNNRKNEIITEKREAERQKAEITRANDENRFEELVPIIARAIGMYFNSRTFKIEKDEMSVERSALNSSASGL